MKKSVVDQFKGKTVAEVVNALKGKTVEVIGNRNSHNYGPVGTKFKVWTGLSSTGRTKISQSTQMTAIDHNGGGNTIMFRDIHLVGGGGGGSIKDLEQEIKDKQDEIKGIKAEIEDIKLKISYLKEIGEKDFDEDEYKAYSIMTLLENGETTKKEKAKLIASLIKS